MKVAIDVSPLTSAHAVRGIGFYTKTLVDGLQKRNDGNEYILVKDALELSHVHPDVIHYPFFDLFFATAPTRQDIPIIVTLHDVTPLVLPDLFPKGLRGWWNLQKQLSKLKKVDHIITDSFASRDDIVRLCKIPENKITAIHITAPQTFHPETDPQKLAEVKRKYNLPDEYLIKVGDINRHKNFTILFQALAQIPSAKLVLVGKALDEKAELIPELVEIIHTIDSLNIKDRVLRLGFVPTEDMNALYTLARCTIQNSLYEGFGLTVLESFLCGTPVIAGNTGSQTEVAGEAGILISQSSVQETVQAINRIYAMPETEFKHLQQKSLEQAKNFSVEKMVSQTIAVYEQYKK